MLYHSWMYLLMPICKLDSQKDGRLADLQEFFQQHTTKNNRTPLFQKDILRLLLKYKICSLLHKQVYPTYLSLLWKDKKANQYSPFENTKTRFSPLGWTDRCRICTRTRLLEVRITYVLCICHVSNHYKHN